MVFSLVFHCAKMPIKRANELLSGNENSTCIGIMLLMLAESIAMQLFLDFPRRRAYDAYRLNYEVDT